MKRAFASACLLLLTASGCSHGKDLASPVTQDNFGVQMARMNLWREALFRFQRTVDISPADAMAHNNLAVALEANGDFDKARKEYLEALKLDKSNQYIQKNYSRYVEFLSRNKKRQLKPASTVPGEKPAPDKAPLPAPPGSPKTPPGPVLPDAGQPNPPVTKPHGNPLIGRSR